MRPQPRLAEIRQLGGTARRRDSIDGSGCPGFNAGGARIARSITTSTSHGRRRLLASACAGVSSHGKSGGSKSIDRQVVRLEVGDVRLRLGADDEARVDADDVGGPVEREVDIAGHRGRGVAVLLGLQRQPDCDTRTRRQRRRRRHRDCDARAPGRGAPRDEAIGDAHAISASSTTARLRRRPACRGARLVARARRSYARWPPADRVIESLAATVTGAGSTLMAAGCARLRQRPIAQHDRPAAPEPASRRACPRCRASRRCARSALRDSARAEIGLLVVQRLTGTISPSSKLSSPSS